MALYFHSFRFACASALVQCASSVTPGLATTSDTRIDDAARLQDAPRIEDVVRDGGLARCWPNDTNTAYLLTCAPDTQFCVDDYAGVGGLHPREQCLSLPLACEPARMCDCIRQSIGPLIRGSHIVCDTTAAGLMRVTVQPD